MSFEFITHSVPHNIIALSIWRRILSKLYNTFIRKFLLRTYFSDIISAALFSNMQFVMGVLQPLERND